MNAEDLIYKVHKNPPIWDKRIKDHANRGVVDACWKKISAAMKIEEHLLRKKWKYLRDQFSTEYYKKNRGQRNATDSTTAQKWQYFNQLLFLKDVINPLSRRSSRNPNPTSDDDDDVNPILDLECVVVNGPDEEPDSLEDNEYQPPEILNGSTSFPTSQPVKRRHLRAEDTFYNKKILLEQENSSTQQYVSHHEPDNDDLLFLKSLLPFVSNIPLDRKLRFRSQVLNIVEEFTSPHSSAAGPNPKPSSAISTNCYENMSGEAEGYHIM